MFNKNSNKSLWILFAALLVIAVLVFTTESTKQERSFKTDIITVDTSAVTSFSIFPKSQKGKEVKFLKDGNTWKVSGMEGKIYTVPNNKVKNLFDQLLQIKPKRVAARSKNKWSEYQVDSSATRVVVREKGSDVLDLIIGKFAFQQPRTMSTFVRLSGENDVYEVDGFLDMTFNKDVNNFRDETVIRSDKENWNKLSFSSNVGESFDLVKVDNFWTIDGAKTDSAKTEKILVTLSRLMNTNFIDVETSKLPLQTSELTINQADGEPIEITAYKNETSYIIKSSQNAENYFDGNKIGDKIFITKESLF
jgi:hypothetical protein